MGLCAVFSEKEGSQDVISDDFIFVECPTHRIQIDKIAPSFGMGNKGA
jgi:hypothetical protein